VLLAKNELRFLRGWQSLTICAVLRRFPPLAVIRCAFWRVGNSAAVKLKCCFPSALFTTKQRGAGLAYHSPALRRLIAYYDNVIF
jgi:hypothetical protein